ncbi:cereblon family protein [Desulfolithobacter sp.]
MTTARETSPAGGLRWTARAHLRQKSERNRHLARNLPGSRSQNHSGTTDDSPLRCARCRAPVTSRSEAISVHNSHEHAFFNPAGIAFEIRCFRQAPGCLVSGQPTSEFTWFGGYTWQLAICAGCRCHLGWFFARPASSFFALIAGNIL